MKKFSNPGRLEGKQTGKLKAQHISYSSDEDESCDAFPLKPNQAKADITVNIEVTPVQVCIDSGATANTIDYSTYEAITAAKALPFKSTNVRLRPYGKYNPAPIPLG